MRIAQSCPFCGEFFVTKVRLTTCPFCDKELPKKKNKESKESAEPKEAQVHHKVKTQVTAEASSDVIGEFVEVQNQVHLLYNLVYGFLAKNNELIKAKSLNSEDLCDFGFICREISKLFDELRKECNARQDLCGSIIAYRLIQASISDPTITMKVKGQFATGTPDVKMQAALPKKFTEDYYKITDFLGVPRDVAEQGVLRLDWKKVTEYLTRLTSEGKNIPEGFGKKYPSYVTTYRKRNN